MRIAVIGSGVVGLSTAAGLIDAGAEVLCYEGAEAPFGARSLGNSRIFRVAHAQADLVDLAVQARAHYQQWSDQAGKPLIGSEGCLVSGPDVEVWASALAEANQEPTFIDGKALSADFPAIASPSQLLLDRAGGVIDVQSVASYLLSLTNHAIINEYVYAIDELRSGYILRTPSGEAAFDGVVIAAGAGTSQLAAQIGIYTPTALAHHARFSFRLRKAGVYPCWLSKPEDGLGTYQHQTDRSTWSVGGHLVSDDVEWTVGREQAVANSRDAVLRYISENLDVIPDVVETLYCTTIPELGDGFKIVGDGHASAIYGENLFKLAPLIGNILARRALDPSTTVRTNYLPC